MMTMNLHHAATGSEESNVAATGSEESNVDRAILGPTPDNPSLSLKKRMKRAAFFDQREREVAAGEAEPVDPNAGLPERMVEEDAMTNRADEPHQYGRVSA